MKKKGTVDWKEEIMGGGFLLQSGILQHINFVIFIFGLIILYIGINFGIERSLLTERQNQRELKHLKADYTSKYARLLYQSKRVEIENRLKLYNSNLKLPSEPPRRLVMEKKP
jgi:hypothetical protein